MSPTGNPLRPVALGAAGLIFVTLLITLVVGIAPNFSTRIVGIAEVFWEGYAEDLRADPEQPVCDPDEVAQRLEQCPPEGEAAAAPAPDAGGDPFADKLTDDEDPFADKFPPVDEDPFADKVAPAPDPFADKVAPEPDPFADKVAPEPDPFADKVAPEPDPFADKAAPEPDPFGDKAADPFADKAEPDPFAASAKPVPEVNCGALRKLHQVCLTRHAKYDKTMERLTPQTRAFRGFEQAISSLAKFPWWKHTLVVLVLLGALSTTVHREHIALRTPHHAVEHYLNQGTQLVSHLFLLFACVADYNIQMGSSAEAENQELPIIWAVGFGLLALVNLFHLIRRPAGLDGPTSLGRLLMVVPLYCYMAILGGVYFNFVEAHPSGQAIFLHKFVQVPNIYLGIGLYIFAGMLLSKTRIARLAFDILLPFKLPAPILGWLVVVIAAVPTAYSGASGIFVIAAGAVIFERLMAAGADKRTALMATAMSGSLGVVLRPCLVVVLIAVLNKQVTTDELFGMGKYVFLVTAVLFFVAMVVINREPFKPAPLGTSLPQAARAWVPLLPYLGVTVAIFVGYWLILDTELSEHTAPLMLPGLMLGLVVYDRVFNRTARGEGEVEESLVPSLFDATHESSGHIGALLCLMFASVGLGGVVERAELMNVVPEQFGSTLLTMSFLVVVMVLVGMTMDALGAVVLVSVTVAKVAYDNGINPVHFWMMVLVAFELGYLTPPVAINHLLARQVIGEEAHVEDDPFEGSFFERYSHLIVPMIVMGSALIMVAYLPLFFYEAPPAP